MGDLTLGDPSVRSSVITALVGLSSALSKQPEVHFTVGAALAIIGGSWQATNTSVFLDLAGVEYPPPAAAPIDDAVNDADMENLLTKCFAEVAPGRPAANRKAVSVWLLCLIKYCGQHRCIKVRSRLAG